MARARNIKPKFFQNDDLGELDPLARLLFIGMWTISDFKGCIEYRPKRIKAQLLAYDECDTEKLISDLDKSGFIAIYSVLGQKYIKILKFAEHQNPHKNEREAGSTLPDFEEKHRQINELKDSGFNRDKDGTNRADSLFPLPSSLILNPVSCLPNPESGTPLKNTVERRGAPLDHDVVPEVFAYWQKVMNSPRSKLDKKRIDLIRSAIKLGYTPRELCEAIKGCSRSPWNMGKNDRNTKFNSLELILRDAGHIDKFMELAGKEVVGEETIEQRNARIMDEFLRGPGSDDPNIIDMEDPDAE